MNLSKLIHGLSDSELKYLLADVAAGRETAHRAFLKIKNSERANGNLWFALSAAIIVLTGVAVVVALK